MNIALAQINPIVGDLPGNKEKIVSYAHRAAEEGADLVIFPELCVTGYPPMDLLMNPLFVESVEATVDELKYELPSEPGIILGAPMQNESEVGKRLFNAALLLENGQLVDSVYKALLPTYDVFDEYRYFEEGDARHVVKWRDRRIGLHICEDMWNNEDQAPYHRYEENPIENLAAQGVDFFVNISASPFHVGKHNVRADIIRSICRQYEVPFIFVNTAGTNTEIVFDGESRVHSSDGTLLRCAAAFEEDLLYWDPDTPSHPCDWSPPAPVEELHDAIVMGIRDYFEKTAIFDKALVGLSGGIDSTVTCALAVEALGSERVVGISMPSSISSKHSVRDAKALAKILEIPYHEISIQPAVASFGKMLKPLFKDTEPGVAEENIQARSRGVTLMALSNKFNYLLLTTGNKSEMAVGYVTLYGDMTGGLSVLSDVLKTEVYDLAEYMNERAGTEIIPRSVIEKPPSAELRPDQKDTDTLPPYPVLDDILRRYIEYQEELHKIVNDTGYDESLIKDILRRVDRNEYKRRQAPPGLRVSSKAFGIGRRLPIVMRWDRDQAATLLVGKTDSRVSDA
jgi:NAD+ synthase (glutamine-hydrolysing)